MDESVISNYILNNKSFLITGGEFEIEFSIVFLIGHILVSIIALVVIKKL